MGNNLRDSLVVVDNPSNFRGLKEEFMWRRGFGNFTEARAAITQRIQRIDSLSAGVKNSSAQIFALGFDLVHESTRPNEIKRQHAESGENQKPSGSRRY